LYSWKNINARFDNIQVDTGGELPTLKAGITATPLTAFAYQPSLPESQKALFDPTAPGNNLFANETFAGFDAQVLDTIETPARDAVGVIAGAQVNVFDQQIFRFLGMLFSDGRFSLVSEIGIEPLMLRVAGISIQIPLALQGRLVLSGRSRGAATHAPVKGEGWADWNVIPNVLRLRTGNSNNPMTLEIHSDGRFNIKGSGAAEIFDGIANIKGQFDISETHCFLQGEFNYQPNFFVAQKRVLALHFATVGRVGPGNNFEFGGVGELSIL